MAARVSVTGENGQLWIANPDSTVIQGTGARATPVYPEFLQRERPDDMFAPVVDRLMTAIDSGQDAQCSGHDYRQVLEVAIALMWKKSGHAGPPELRA